MNLEYRRHCMFHEKSNRGHKEFQFFHFLHSIPKTRSLYLSRSSTQCQRLSSFSLSRTYLFSFAQAPHFKIFIVSVLLSHIMYSSKFLRFLRALFLGALFAIS